MAVKYTGFVAWAWKKISGFDYDKYWKMRDYVVSHDHGIIAWVNLFRVKKIEARFSSSLGTHLGHKSATFLERPFLPHGLNGIVVSNDTIIGRKCQLYHQVTIGGGNGGSPVIGDNVLIGAGAKIIGPVHIGDNVKIGAGCVVAIDVPDNCTVVMAKPRIIVNRREVNQ